MPPVKEALDEQQNLLLLWVFESQCARNHHGTQSCRLWLVGILGSLRSAMVVMFLSLRGTHIRSNCDLFSITLHKIRSLRVKLVLSISPKHMSLLCSGTDSLSPPSQDILALGKDYTQPVLTKTIFFHLKSMTMHVSYWNFLMSSNYFTFISQSTEPWLCNLYTEHHWAYT